MPPVVCLLVGLHVVPLARVFDQPQYPATAAGLCVAAAAGLVIVVAGTLWATSLVPAVRP